MSSFLRCKIERKLLPYIEKPVRYIGNELNCCYKSTSDVTLRGVLCFPELYDIGMSHYGSQILYNIINRHKEWSLTRAFHPWKDAEIIMRREKIPLYSLEDLLPLESADWIGFTLQYELQYSNMINMLDLAGIPLRSDDRSDEFPLVICGGPCMTNPEPVSDFIDIAVIGDGEDVIVLICKTIEKMTGRSKRDILMELDGVRGIYVPSLHNMKKNGSGNLIVSDMKKSVFSAKVPCLYDNYYPENQVIPIMETVHKRCTVEIMRGCLRGCRFCSAGTYYRPLRERSPKSIADQISSEIQNNGWDEVGLLSLSTADYSGLEYLLKSMESLRKKKHTNFSLPSTRIDALNDNLLRELNSVSPSSSFTIAPEAGSQRLRDVINKDFSHDEIINAVQRLFKNNVVTLKLYFMTGLPTEKNEDIDAIIKMVSEISRCAGDVRKRIRINVAISPFSPKPHTPFQWEKMESVELLWEKAKKIKNILQRFKNVTVSFRDPAITFLETVLARGDRRCSELIETAWELGAKMDGWDEYFDLNIWKRAAEKIGMDLNIYTGSLLEEDKLPWDHVSTGIDIPFLKTEREKAYRGELTGDCRETGCLNCGACNEQAANMIWQKKNTKEYKEEHFKKNDFCDDSVNRQIYRCVYEKKDFCRYLSHRDLIPIIHRAVVSCDIPVLYTKGYHPRPKISFGPPLPVGISGRAELLDMVLVSEFDPDLKLLNSKLPRGINILRIYRIAGKAVSVSSSVRAARYSIRPLFDISIEELLEKIDVFKGLKEAVVTTRSKKGEKKKDIRPLVESIDIKSEDSDASFTAVLSLKSESMCRPSELLRAVFPEKDSAGFYIERSGIFFNT